MGHYRAKVDQRLLQYIVREGQKLVLAGGIGYRRMVFNQYFFGRRECRVRRAMGQPRMSE